ncbi:hypothetical protein DQG13_20155 [Paenibacillus sp. YN15]|nr:hypothetical protein DQG13_20155 [Paenibacillus sp. YN15]
MRIAALEKKLAKEIELRQKLSQELEQSKKQLFAKEKEKKQVENELTEQAKQVENSERKVNEGIRQLEMKEQIWSTVQQKWNVEREKLNKQIRAQEQEIRKLAQQVGQLSNKTRQLRTIAAEFKHICRNSNELIGVLCKALDEDIRQISCNWIEEGRTGINGRKRMQVILHLLDALDAYRQQEERTSDGLSLSVDASMEPSSLSELTEAAKEINQTNGVYTGTFYRRDHGGYIQLENGEVFNITESLVNNHQLEHKAEVQCRPYLQDNGATFYDIELLFQGDDAYAPIRQYVGYVQLGEHYTWYCVDLNDSTCRFPLHRKDIEIQQPEDGMPCTFNVSEEGEFARLSKVYRQFTKTEEEFELARTEMSKARSNSSVPAAKPSAFLTGCTVAIIGGQRKWFEEVVAESGAVLVHDNGEHTERIAADLRRSQALFLLLTATSHRATWGGIEIAKACGMPHFTIQGSKSNLRKQLWDNRETIRAGLQ